MTRVRLLYLVPETALAPELAHHGSSKDIASLQAYFDARGVSVTARGMPRSSRAGVHSLAGLDLRPFDVVVVSLPGSHPGVLAFVRKSNPCALLLFRAHNAEGLHRLDWMRAARTTRARLLFAMRALTALIKDLLTVRLYADRVLAISESDARSYWRRLGNQGRVTTVPYFIPVAPIAAPRARARLCVCVTAVLDNPLAQDALHNFCEMVSSLGSQQDDWSFCVIGSGRPRAPTPSRVRVLGQVDSASQFLLGATCVALLSDFGRGFKTKILEAIQAGCWVLLTPVLYSRLPAVITPFCITVQPGADGNLASALAKCDRPWPLGDPNAVLKRDAFAALDEVLGLDRCGGAAGAGDLRQTERRR